ncbi:1-phosphatidylinositol phosphodiesterase [Electrophorus electricus]|uniref:Phosphatidylinositol-specific phospholipase C X domain-containing protein n=1 Tax=Electrophorus electricus TaxID=8005 RepID=A0A4W4EMA2_ELEEL|nr:1-phosphatidylinositol phosphodiesterase [Electrophorus electricus]
MHIVIVGILLWLACPGHGALQRPDYDDTPTPEFLQPSWMANIPDNRPLCEVTIPGTHNSMALYGGFLAQCNSWPLAQQLQAGVRFLDVRVRHIQGNLTIYHGVLYQWAHFGEVLEDVAAFLKQNPTETVLMRLREELSETRDIYRAVVTYVHQYAHWDLLWHSQLMPTMGEARGKLIILQDFPGPHLGMQYRSLEIADDWKVLSLQPKYVDKKWKSVRTHLEEAAMASQAYMFLTYSSGAGFLANPQSLAKRINPRLYDYLFAHAEEKKRFGIIAMDFSGAMLVKLIIDFN